MGKKILIVDDEPEILMLVSARLKASGYDVVTASDGQEGLDKAKAEMPDIMLLDVMMPKMDGYKVCGLLKADTRYQKIPIVMFTARAGSADEEMREDVGANGYLSKPLDSEAMLKLIEELLGA